MSTRSADRAAEVRGWATFSRDRRYRYSLGRSWAEGPRVCWVLLNPSAADAHEDDPTLRRCLAFARAWGAGSIEVVNLFALVSARPSALRGNLDPVGTSNQRAVRRAVARADLVVAGWGNVPLALHAAAKRAMRGLPEVVWCLGLTGSCSPRHPLYVPSSMDRVPFEVPR
jgi:hypothetical protein